MLTYKLKYTESEYDIQNIIIVQIDQKRPNTFELLENVGKFRKIKNR